MCFQVVLSDSTCAAIPRFYFLSNDEYLKYTEKLDATAADTYRYLNFDELPEFLAAADKVRRCELTLSNPR